MKGNAIEIVASAIWGVIAFFIYAPYMGIVFSFTIKVFDILKYIPCDNAPCNLRQFIYYVTLIIHDTLIGLPLFLFFGFLLGLAISKFQLSRPLILYAGFFFAQCYYLFIHTDLGLSLPFYVEILRAIPIGILFILFTKLGFSIKSKPKGEKGNKSAQPAA